MTPATPAADRTPLTMSRRSRRRIGAALVAYGVIGVVLSIVVAAAGLWGAVRLDDAMARIEAQRVELAATVGAAADALASTIATIEASRPGFDRLTGLTSQLSGVIGDVAAAADDLAGRMEVSILGFQPFSGLGAQLGGVAGQLEAIGTEVESIGPAISVVSGGTGTISASLASLQARLDALSTRIESLGPFDETGRILAIGLTLLVLLDLWLAIPALTAIFVGLRLRRG